MVSIGMIFQFNRDEGTGLIMLSDGAQKEFSVNEWTDGSTTPSVGLQIVYEISDNTVKIKVPSEEEKNELQPARKSKQEKELTEFSSLEEFENYFSKKGFDVMNTNKSSDSELNMLKYTDEGVQSVSIQFNNAKSELTKDFIVLSSIEEHIQFFKDTGYRVISDVEDDESRMLSLRRYVMDEHSEIKIRCSEGNITHTKTVNGKIVD